MWRRVYVTIWRLSVCLSYLALQRTAGLLLWVCLQEILVNGGRRPVKHVSFLQHLKKYVDCINAKYVAEIWHRIA